MFQKNDTDIGGLCCPLPLNDHIRDSAANAAQSLFRGDASQRGGFNCGVAWCLQQLYDADEINPNSDIYKRIKDFEEWKSKKVL